MTDRFNSNPRRQQELRCRPYADEIYRRIFGDIVITRAGEENKELEQVFLLDRVLAIDIQIRQSSGLILTGQEKFLSYEYAKYRTVTIEHMQNPKTNEQGDWFKLASQFYFCGYEEPNKKTFNPWVILDWSKVVIETEAGRIKWREGQNKDGHARATFRFTSMDSIPAICVIAKSEESNARRSVSSQTMADARL